MLLTSQWAFAITAQRLAPSSLSLILLFSNRPIALQEELSRQLGGEGRNGVLMFHIPAASLLHLKTAGSLRAQSVSILLSTFLVLSTPYSVLQFLPRVYTFWRKYGLLHYDTWLPPTGQNGFSAKRRFRFGGKSCPFLMLLILVSRYPRIRGIKFFKFRKFLRIPNVCS